VVNSASITKNTIKGECIAAPFNWNDSVMQQHDRQGDLSASQFGGAARYLDNGANNIVRSNQIMGKAEALFTCTGRTTILFSITIAQVIPANR
jgi:hypothetical protein